MQILSLHPPFPRSRWETRCKDTFAHLFPQTVQGCCWAGAWGCDTHPVCQVWSLVVVGPCEAGVCSGKPLWEKCSFNCCSTEGPRISFSLQELAMLLPSNPAAPGAVLRLSQLLCSCPELLLMQGCPPGGGTASHTPLCLSLLFESPPWWSQVSAHHSAGRNRTTLPLSN